MKTKTEWVEWKDWNTVQTVRRRGPHQFTRKMKRCPWPYCARCGLLLLKNDATRRAAKAQCEWEDKA